MTDDSAKPDLDPVLAAHRSADDALLAELTEPPPLEDAQETLDFWRRRLEDLPIYKRAERQEARESIERWQQRVRAAERARFGPSPLEQLLDALGLRWRPRKGRLIAGLGALAVLVLLSVIAAAIAIVVFWPEIEPIVRTLLNNGGNRDG